MPDDRPGPGAAGECLRSDGRLRHGCARSPHARRAASPRRGRAPRTPRRSGAGRSLERMARLAEVVGARAARTAAARWRSRMCTPGSTPSAAVPASTPSGCRRTRRRACCTWPGGCSAKRWWASRSSSAPAARPATATASSRRRRSTDDPRPSLANSTVEDLLVALFVQHEGRRLDSVQWLRETVGEAKLHETGHRPGDARRVRRVSRSARSGRARGALRARRAPRQGALRRQGAVLGAVHHLLPQSHRDAGGSSAAHVRGGVRRRVSRGD